MTFDALLQRSNACRPPHGRWVKSDMYSLGQAWPVAGGRRFPCSESPYQLAHMPLYQISLFTKFAHMFAHLFAHMFPYPPPRATPPPPTTPY